MWCKNTQAEATMLRLQKGEQVNVLITGGTGFVGRAMRTQQPKYFDATYLSRNDYESSEWTYHKYNYIVHLANIAPTFVLENAYGARVLYCSSGIVYYENEQQRDYRKNKIEWEQECLTSGLDVVIARLFTFTGDLSEKWKAYPSFIDAAKAGKPIHIKGNGKTRRSYMDTETLGLWMWAILFKGKTGEAYDVGADESITMFELAQKVNAEFCPGNKIIIENQDNGDPMPVYLPYNTTKTKKIVDQYRKEFQ
jgi:nucleoside-diphosphate-sugar epimerase